MLDSALKVINKLIQLLQIRELRRKERFDKFVQPLFSDLSTIHDNYQKFLGNVVIRLKNNPKSIVKIVNSLRKHREDYSHLRHTTRIISKEFAKKFEDDPISEFIFAVSNYFPDGDLKTDPSASTQILELFSGWDGGRELMNQHGETVKDPIQYFISTIETHLMLQNYNWKTVCERYAKLKSETY